MNKSDYPDPNNDIFYCDKSDWYEENEKGLSDWSKSKDQVVEFWRKVREEKMAKQDFDFSHFIFPEFLDSDFFQVGIRVFSGVTDFSGAQFLGDAQFFRIQFSQKAIFDSAKFSKKANFLAVKFLKEAHFRKSQFYDTTYFQWAHFSEYVDFEEVEFSRPTKFDHAQFFKNVGFFLSRFSRVSFYNTKFSGKTNFISTRFSGLVNFNLSIFEGECFWRKVVFENDKYNSISFTTVTFSAEKRTLFEDWQLMIPLFFCDVIFPDAVQFQACNMEMVVFKSCDLVKVSFSNCDFKKKKGRLVLYNDWKETPFDKGKDYKSLSNTYRQLKRNLMEAKDWTNAGDAYKSEMVMTRKLLQQQIWQGQLGKLAHWIVMWFYQVFSGYQQSIGRPFYSLLILLIVCPIVLYIFDEKDQGGFIAVKTSLEAAFPFAGKINVRCYHPYFYTLLLFERLMSIVLLTFFGLATRARLRQ